MPLVEQELLILPEKMSSPKVLMGVHIARSLVSWEGGGKSPLSYRSTLWTDISRASGILKGPIVQKFSIYKACKILFLFQIVVINTQNNLLFFQKKHRVVTVKYKTIYYHFK